MAELFRYITHTYQTLRKPSMWFFTTWFKFLARYRRTAIGPLWIVASPLMFIGFLGLLFVGLSNFSTSEFIPHLAVGMVAWTLLGGYLIRSPNVFNRNRAYIYQGKATQTDIIVFDNAELVVHFIHQCIIIVAFCWYYKTGTSFSNVGKSLLGLFFIIINGYWITLVFGILGARFRDFGEMITSITGIAFLATPIIWMPVKDGGDGGRLGVLDTYITYNPFYHFLETFRAPLLGESVALFSWQVVWAITILGYLLATYMYYRYRHMIVFWM